MKKVFALSLALLILFLSGKDLFTYAYFFYHQEYITKNICVNRFTPEVMCSGKCYLTTLLEQNEQERQAQAFLMTEKKASIVFPPCEDVQIFCTPAADISSELIAATTSVYAYLYSGRIFHPPQT